MVIDAITEIQGGRRGRREEDKKREEVESHFNRLFPIHYLYL